MKASDIEALQAQALLDVDAAADLRALEEVRVKYLGSKGLLREIMQQLKAVDPAERPAFGRHANLLKTAVTERMQVRKDALAQGAERAAPALDLTLPGRWRGIGSRHPVTLLTDKVVGIFHTMGFTVAQGPDIETVFNNFDALNTPPDHPSRDPQDTFYLESGEVLRTHTSPVQVRYMLQHPPPVRIIAPGRCYRRDTPDATHSANFHQIEGLYVSHHVSMADLKGDLSYFARKLMGPDVQVRFRPHFFPFTEPSVEVDFSCHLCHGNGCRVCKHSGWIEIAGAGMVDPEVFRAVGYDPDQVTGYAFGMGIERMAMILFGIADIRHLYENDLRFLAQFG